MSDEQQRRERAWVCIFCGQSDPLPGRVHLRFGDDLGRFACWPKKRVEESDCASATTAETCPECVDADNVDPKHRACAHHQAPWSCFEINGTRRCGDGCRCACHDAPASSRAARWYEEHFDTLRSDATVAALEELLAEVRAEEREAVRWEVARIHDTTESYEDAWHAVEAWCARPAQPVGGKT